MDTDGGATDPLLGDWRVGLGSTSLFAWPFSEVDGSLEVVGAPDDLRVTVTRTDGWPSDPAIAVRSLDCRPAEVDFSLRWTTASGVLEEPVHVSIVAGTGPGALLPFACMRIEESYGGLVADTDGEHGHFLSRDCRFHRVDMATMQFDLSPVQLFGVGDECGRLTRAIDGRLYAETRAAGAAPTDPWLRFRLDEAGEVDGSFAIRPAANATVDALGGDIVVDNGTLQRRDATGAVDPSFLAPTFGDHVALFPLSNGVVVADSEPIRGAAWYVFMTTLDATGSVVVPRRLIDGGENARLNWIVERAGGELLAHSSADAVDTGAVGVLWHLVGPSSRRLLGVDSLVLPFAGSAGEVYAFGTRWVSLESPSYESLMFRVAPDDTITTFWYFWESWGQARGCSGEAYSATSRRDGMIAFVARDRGCDRGYQMVGAMRSK